MKSFLVGLSVLILAPIALVLAAPVILYYLISALGDMVLGTTKRGGLQ